MSASFLARAIARADTFDLGAARKRRDTRAMDIDIPLDGDGTGEYEPLQRKNSGALAPEEEIGEYNRLSDAPAVAQELASMRQTRLARTVLTGVLTLFLVVFGPLGPHGMAAGPLACWTRTRLRLLILSQISFCWP